MTYENTFLTKNGKECLIRALARGDGRITYDNFNQTHAESAEFLLSYADENTFTPEREAEILDEWLQSDVDAELGAFVDGVLVGTAGIHPIGRKDKVRHRCEFGVSVLKAYHGLGIGKALTEACTECAKSAGFLQIELDVVAQNEIAVSLYKKLGFTEFGRNDYGFRTREGVRQAILLMKKEI